MSAEILACSYQTSPEELLPDSIYGNASCQRITLADQPAGKAQSICGLPFRQSRKEVRYASADGLPFVQKATSNVDVGLARVRSFFHCHRLDDLGLRAMQFRYLFPNVIKLRGDGTIVGCEPGLLLRAALVGRQGQDSAHGVG